MSEEFISGLLWAGAGVGVIFFLLSFRKKPVPLSEIILILRQDQFEDHTDNILDTSAKPLTGTRKLLGRAGTRIFRRIAPGNITEAEKKLRILDKSLERHCYEKMLGGLIGFMLPVFLWWILLVIGLDASIGLFVALSLLLLILGYWYPDIPLNEQVEKRKRAFRYAFSSYLDLVTVMLAGGGGIETALTVSAEAGGGWAFGLIRKALLRARLRNQAPWLMFEELGKEIGVNELSELAASISLAGRQGARIRDSMLVKADSLRSIQLAEIETEAESRSEKMTIPVLVMVVGLILFIGYGAVQAITVDTVPAISGLIVG